VSITAGLEKKQKKKKKRTLIYIYKNIYKIFLEKLVKSHVFLRLVRIEDFLHFLSVERQFVPAKCQDVFI